MPVGVAGDQPGSIAGRKPDRRMAFLARRAQAAHRPGQIDQADLFSPFVIFGHIGKAPEGTNAARVIELAFSRYNLSLGAGLSKVAGKVFRIGHVGDLNELMLMGAIAGAEMAMLDVGIAVTPGSGVAAASGYWRTHDPIAQDAAIINNLALKYCFF